MPCLHLSGAVQTPDSIAMCGHFEKETQKFGHCFAVKKKVTLTIACSLFSFCWPSSRNSPVVLSAKARNSLIFVNRERKCNLSGMYKDCIESNRSILVDNCVLYDSLISLLFDHTRKGWKSSEV